jgi:hypothetical protein
MNEMYVVIDAIVGMVAVIYAIEVVCVLNDKRDWESNDINRKIIRQLAERAGETPVFKYKSYLIKCTVCCAWILSRHCL